MRNKISEENKYSFLSFLKKREIRFFGCEGDESREAYQLVLKSGIDCEIYLLSDVESPLIRDGYTCYTGIREIRNFVEEYKNKISKQSAISQKINIETIRAFTENNEYVNLRGLVSLISLEKIIKDFKGKENNKLCLKTTWFTNGGGYHWSMWLENKDRNSICYSPYFNKLNEHFSSYSKERLENWQNVAIKEHRKYLSKIEDLYWAGGVISKDFF